MDEQARQAVRRFLLRARAHPEIGTEEVLAERISSYSRHYGIKRSGVGHWFNLSWRSQPNAWVLFALAADLDISLDDFVFGDRSHANRLANLEDLVFDLTNWKQAIEQQLTSLRQPK